MFMVHILCKLEEDAVLLWLRACVCENEWSQRQCRIRGKTVRNVRNSEKKCSASHTLIQQRGIISIRG